MDSREGGNPYGLDRTRMPPGRRRPQRRTHPKPTETDRTQGDHERRHRSTPSRRDDRDRRNRRVRARTGDPARGGRGAVERAEPRRGTRARLRRAPRRRLPAARAHRHRRPARRSRARRGGDRLGGRPPCRAVRRGGPRRQARAVREADGDLRRGRAADDRGLPERRRQARHRVPHALAPWAPRPRARRARRPLRRAASHARAMVDAGAGRLQLACALRGRTLVGARRGRHALPRPGALVHAAVVRRGRAPHPPHHPQRLQGPARRDRAAGAGVRVRRDGGDLHVGAVRGAEAHGGLRQRRVRAVRRHPRPVRRRPHRDPRGRARVRDRRPLHRRDRGLRGRGGRGPRSGGERRGRRAQRGAARRGRLPRGAQARGRPATGSTSARAAVAIRR